METLYTLEEVSEYLKVKKDTVYKWTTSGKLKSIKIGGVVRVTESELQSFVNKSSK